MRSFRKYQAQGNDFLVGSGETLSSTEVRALLSRRFGVGADGLILRGSSPKAARLFNGDGSEAGFSGNGVRALGLDWILYPDSTPSDAGSRRLPPPPLEIEVGLGERAYPLTLESQGNDGFEVSLRLSLEFVESKPFALEDLPSALQARLLRATWVDLGNPHLILEAEAPLPELAPELDQLRKESERFPTGINVSVLVEFPGREFQLDPFERGVGPTLSCASASLAAATCLQVAGLELKDGISIRLPGGELGIRSLGRELELKSMLREVAEVRWKAP